MRELAAVVQGAGRSIQGPDVIGYDSPRSGQDLMSDDTDTSDSKAVTRDQEIVALIAEGAHRRATERALQVYGTEIRGYLHRTVDSADDADDVFSTFCEDLWRGIATFAGRSTLRAWLYRVAKNARHRFHRQPYERRRTPLAARDAEALQALTRSVTRPYLRTDAKDGLARIRERLDDADNELLILRVDRKLAWSEIAEVLAEGDDLDPDARRRASTRLRMRYQRLLARIRKLAQAEGLL